MITVGLDGPSFAGKSTFLKKLHTKLEQLNVSCAYLPCYMDCLEHFEREIIPLNRNIGLASEKIMVARFIEIEKRRAQLIDDHLHDIILIDRTIMSVLAHSYAATKLTDINFFIPTVKQVDQNRHQVVVPFLSVYITTSQFELLVRAQNETPTIFTNKLYNSWFEVGYRDSSLKSFQGITLRFSLNTPQEMELYLTKLTNFLLSFL